ncbi:MAG: hypothetical protein V4587_06845, partial [Acidobacteriota bacterium]
WIPLAAGEPFYPAYACSAACFTAVNLSNLGAARSHPAHVNAANYFSYYQTRAGFHSVRYVHEKTATIAVAVSALASGGAMTPETAVHALAASGSSRRILSHPQVAPTIQSVQPQPVNQVPVPAERPAVVVALHSGGTIALQSGTGEPAQQVGERFYLIARTAPPVTGPTLDQQLPALRQNEGRPLDPGQLQNLAAGRPAGRATMPEFPPEIWTSTRGAAVK